MTVIHQESDPRIRHKLLKIRVNPWPTALLASHKSSSSQNGKKISRKVAKRAEKGQIIWV
jgi:hypothetical protein